MRYCPSLVPDAATAAALGIGTPSTSNNNNNEDMDDEQMNTTDLSSSRNIHELIKEALYINNQNISIIIQQLSNMNMNNNQSSSSSSSSSLLLSELPYQLRLLNPSSTILKQYYTHILPHIEPSLLSMTNNTASTTFINPFNKTINPSSVATLPTSLPKQIKLSLHAHKTIQERNNIIQQCTQNLSKLALSQIQINNNTEGKQDTEINTYNIKTIETNYENTIITMMQYLRGITPAANLALRTMNGKTVASGITPKAATTITTNNTSTIPDGNTTTINTKKRERSDDMDQDNNQNERESKRLTKDQDDASIATQGSENTNAGTTTTTTATTTTTSISDAEKAQQQKEKLVKQINESKLLNNDQRILAIAFTNKLYYPEHFPDKKIYEQYLSMRGNIDSSTTVGGKSPALTNLLRVTLPLEDTELSQNNKLIKARTYLELNYETHTYHIYAKKL